MKIMQVNYKMDVGGIESFLMNVYRNIDRKNYEFIFLTYYDKHFDFEEEINNLGGRIIRISNPRNVSVVKHIKELLKIFKAERPDVVHCHTYFNSAYVMLAAYLSGIKTRITHSHTTYALREKNIIKKIKWTFSRLLIRLFATDKVACSNEAGQALFGNIKYKIISNGINLEKYFFNKSLREKFRNEWKAFPDTLVIGHVGRIDVPKNHKFLIEIFSSLVNEHDNCKLVMVGTGPLEDQIKGMVKEKNLEDKIIFLGNRSDVNEILNGFDIFVFPSIFEGLPVSLVEAQANGINCLISDVVTKDVAITDLIHYLSLEVSSNDWATKISNFSVKRKNTKKELLSSCYSIESTVKSLVELYTDKNN